MVGVGGRVGIRNSLMRLSWALVSAWTSASHRRCAPAFGFSGWKGTKARSVFQQSSSKSVAGKQMSELRPKCTSMEGSTLIAGREILSNGGWGARSPYERRLGKLISLCPKCRGEGRVRAPLSKKARAHRKKLQQNNGTSSQVGEEGDPPSKPLDQRSPTKPCRVCEGSGLVVAPPPPDDGGNELGDGVAISQPSPKVRPNFSVAIVGGGIGGLALAAALQKRGIPCIVYERDLSFEERKQGYGLTMQQGARALRSLGFFAVSNNEAEKFPGSSDGGVTKPEPGSRFGIHSTRHVVHRPDGTVVGEWGMKVWGGRFEKNGRKHAKRQNAHISRQNLRRLLMDMLLPGTINWGHKLVDYSAGRAASDCNGNKGPRLDLTFRRRTFDPRIEEGGCEEEFVASASILVGCDGIRSAVRAIKLGENAAPLRYLGCIVILGIAASPESALTDGETVFQTADGITRLYAMPFARHGEEGGVLLPEGTARGLSMWQLSFPMEESDAIKLSRRGPSGLKSEALRRCREWHEPIPQLLSSAPEDLITGYPCYDRALTDGTVFREGHSPSDASGDPFVTMLGDAAHPMSPFKGQGANQALLDAVLLARSLYAVVRVSGNGKSDGVPDESLDDRVRASLAEFEEEMLRRSAIKVRKSADAAEFLHSAAAVSEGNVTRGAAASGQAGSRG